MRKLFLTFLNLKKATLFILGVLFLSTTVTAEDLKIFIKVDNAVEQEVAIYYFKHKKATDQSIAKIYLNETGEVEFMFNIEGSQLVNIFYNKQMIPVFISENQLLKMYFDAKNIWRTLSFEGGDAEANNFLAAYHREFPPQTMTTFEAGYIPVDFPELLLSKARKMTPDQFKRGMEDRAQQQKAFLKKEKTAPDFLLERISQKAAYEHAVEYMMYFVLNQPNWPREHLIEEKEKNKSFRWSKLHNEKLIEEKYYQNFLKACMFYSFLPGNPDDFDVVNLLYDHVGESFKKQARFWLQAELMIRQYDRTGRTRLAKKHFNTYYEENPYPEFSQKIIDTYGMELDFVPETDAPDFSVIDTSGNQLTLSGFKDRVVYVSFWASWCKPCIKGFAKTEYLRKDLEKMGVVLLNVSLDKEEDVWKKSLEKYKITGINVLAPEFEEIQQIYGLSTLPAYHIIGKNGRFCYLSNKKGRNILEEFRGFVD